MLEEICKNAETLKEKEQTNTFLYLLPDTENKFVKVFEITKSSDYLIEKQWMEFIADAFAEYYRDTDTYDSAEQDIGPVELVLNAIKKNNIPLVRYWESANTEMLSTRWLNQQT